MVYQIKLLTQLFCIVLIAGAAASTSLATLTSSNNNFGHEEIEYFLQAQKIQDKSQEQLLADLLIETALRGYSKHQKTRTPLIEAIADRLTKNALTITQHLDNHSYEASKATFGLLTAGLMAFKGLSKFMSPTPSKERLSIVSWLAAASTFAVSYFAYFIDGDSLLDTTTRDTYRQQADFIHQLALVLDKMKRSEHWPLLIQKLSSVKDERKLR